MIFALALMLVSAAPAEPIDRAAIRVIDGDTIAVAGITYRLVGYDTPEVGRRAHCVSERELGAKATARLKALIAAASSSTPWLARAGGGPKERRHAITGGSAVC